MFNKEPRLYIEDIQVALKRIEDYTRGITFGDFIQDQKTIDAVVRNLSVIGEAVKNLPQEVKSIHPDIPWNEIMGMRNKVIHEYFAVDEEILWKTIQEDISKFKLQIDLLASEYQQW